VQNPEEMDLQNAFDTTYSYYVFGPLHQVTQAIEKVSNEITWPDC